MKFRSLAALLALSAALSACVSGSDSTAASPSPTSGFRAQFNPDAGVLPFPNDLYSGTNGQLNIPGDAKVAQNGPLLELNHLDGYGTQSDISVYFTSSIDPKSIDATDVMVLKVASDPTNKAVNPTGTPAPQLLKQGTDYVAEVSPGIDVGSSILTIKPLHPLAPSTVNATTHAVTFSTYMVIITSGLKDTTGAAATQSDTFSKVVTADAPLLAGGKYVPTGDAIFDAAAQFTAPQLALAAGLGLNLKDVAVTFSFSTEFLGLSLGEISATATASTGAVAPTGLTTHNISSSLPGIADIYAGSVTIPYYLTVPTASNPTAALTDSWHNASGGDTIFTDPMPKKTSDQTIPVLMGVPNAGSGCTMPGTGWPVVIFQHGITQNRTNVIAVADALASQCFAVVAIDLPLHGITDTSTSVTTNPFYENQLFKGTAAASLVTGERTFNMDLENNSTGAAGPDGQVDGSGAWFINLTSTITSRDNLREAAADLISLTRTIQAGKLTVLGGPSILDGSKIGFVGHSLGGIVGTVYLGVDPSAFAATLAMPGGHIAELLRNSPEFEPIIDNGLAQNGLVKGTQAYYDFYSQAQAVVEDGDPANYAAAAAAQHPIHMIEVVGDGTSANPPDQVVPNIATDVLIAEMGITAPISTVGLNPVSAGVGNSTLAQFTSGGHGSLLEPAANTAAQLAITTEMQTEMASIFATTGTAVKIADNSHLSTTLKK
ncbi:MAG TPA: hypothetical protein VLV87_02215 [Gammaproteobacteria bacterium]|nr:hypothetical protein [Gammaproteobacteria bacterium]